ncbi:glucan endo-1,3-beta-glucosidase-like [Phragmites australis]|uniref:glucan endo-1,3-beta-glucosidase-like n=1 Tax=Phragmites australis TaxID=29695 RepID=UPI002D773978|nr:glucan endo-1,3-beta-glucosidase-like [Phragmites australis]
MAPPSWHGQAVLLLLLVPFATAIGVNYGTKGDNLPSPATVASFLANRTRVDRVKLFDTNPDMVRAFAGTGIALMVTAGNGDIPKLATKDGAAAWVAANVAPYYPATEISLVAVGNEIMATADKGLITNLVPAMRTLKAALTAAGYPKIRVSTPHSLGILSVSEPPSASRFRDGYDRLVFAPMLEFHRQTKSPFIVNPYPYFGYNGATLPYALARPNPGVPDPGTGITYTSMFEAQLDSVYSAMKKLEFEDVEIAVGETGWPSKAEDGQIGVSPAEAAEYNRYLIGEASAGSGTPLMPKRTFETYIFSLFNENLKPGPVAERNFGLFQADLTPVYDVGLMKGAVRTFAESPERAPSKAGNAGKAAKKHDTEVAAPPIGTKAANGSSKASASAPAPSSGDDAPLKATGPAPSGAPSEGDSTDDKTPVEEGGDAPAVASGPAGESSKTAAKKTGSGEAGTSPAQAGAASEATNLLIPISSVLTVALSLALHI